jgi:gas vesicle protein
MNRTLSFIRGLIIGGMIGAGLALLLTPASGDELREQMQARAHRLQMEAKNAAAARRAELEQQLEILRQPKKTG